MFLFLIFLGPASDILKEFVLIFQRLLSADAPLALNATQFLLDVDLAQCGASNFAEVELFYEVVVKITFAEIILEE